VIDERDRLRALVGAGIALSSARSLDELLQRLVDTAAALTGARYAALGVIDREGQALERFITTGIDREQHEAIGELPHGRGILGVLIHNAETLRLHDLSDDPRSVGFPPNHPPMRTFLGVPVMLRDVAYGNLYLTEKEGSADFTEEDAEIVGLLAAQAAVAIENARLYESATRWSSQLEALNEVGTALASEIELPRLLALITQHLRKLIDARLASHERRKEKIFKLIEERPRTGYELAQAIWGNVAVTQAFLTLSEVIGHTDILVNEGRGREDFDGSAVRYETTA